MMSPKAPRRTTQFTELISIVFFFSQDLKDIDYIFSYKLASSYLIFWYNQSFCWGKERSRRRSFVGNFIIGVSSRNIRICRNEKPMAPSEFSFWRKMEWLNKFSYSSSLLLFIIIVIVWVGYWQTVNSKCVIGKCWQ